MLFVSSRKARHEKSVRPRCRSCRPRLEILEDRSCPSTSSYTVTDLGLSPYNPGPFFPNTSGLYEIVSLNNALQVVDQAGTGNSSVAAYHAFFRQNGAFTDLGTLGGPNSRATAINNATLAQVVGWADTSQLNSSGANIYHASKWEQVSGNWSITDLGTLAVTNLQANSQATAINLQGQVVGWSDTDIVNSGGGYVQHLFLWQNGTITDLNNLMPIGWTLSAGKGIPNGINDSGQITGAATLNGVTYAVLLTPSGSSGYNLTQLVNLTGGPLHYSGFGSFGSSINSSGQVVGASNGSDAFWQNATIVTNVGNKSYGGPAYGVNNAGQVVGSLWSIKGPYAFLWQSGKLTNLNNLIPKNSGWNLIEADRINEPDSTHPNGSIVGIGTYTDGNYHMFLAIDPPVVDRATGGAIPASSVANAAMTRSGASSEAIFLIPSLQDVGLPAPRALKPGAPSFLV